MSELKYELKPETKKPSRKYRKGSKYDPIIESFRKSPHSLMKVEIEGTDANYIRTQLKKRLDAQNITDISVSVVNATAYLEKEKPAPKKVGKPEPTAPVKKPEPTVPTVPV